MKAYAKILGVVLVGLAIQLTLAAGDKGVGDSLVSRAFTVVSNINSLVSRAFTVSSNTDSLVSRAFTVASNTNSIVSRAFTARNCEEGAGELCPDCDGDGIPDQCELDCGDDDGACDIEGCGQSVDCNGNGVPDECETDCNENGIADECDIDGGTSQDCNANGIPDECELEGNDCNANTIPDECELGENDCNLNQLPDDCDIAGGTSEDCNGNGIPDDCEIDCNSNGVPDDCDITEGTSLDCQSNGVPDECEADCNLNEIPDDCDIANGTSDDCNANGLPDECEIDENSKAPGAPYFCQMDCDPDCNENGIPDECDIADCLEGDPDCGDCNNDTVPDFCNIEGGVSEDLDLDGVPDECSFWDSDQGAWDSPKNWDPVGVPNNDGKTVFGVTIDGPLAAVTLDIDATINSLVIGEPARLDVTFGDLTLASSNGIANHGVLLVGDGQSIVAAESFTLTGSGTVTLAGATAILTSDLPGHTLTNATTIEGFGVIDADFVNQGSVIANSPGETLSIVGPNLKINDGTFEATNGALLVITNAIVSGTGDYSATGGSIILSPDTAGASISGSALEAVSAGLILVGGDSSIDLTGGVILDTGGVYKADPDQTGPISASMNAASVLITGDLSGGAGQMRLEGSMSVEFTDGIVLVLSDTCADGARGGCTPPILSMVEQALMIGATMEILDGGMVLVADEVTIDLSDALTIDTGGVYQADPDRLDSTSATLNAADLLLTNELGGDGAAMILDDLMEVHVVGDILINAPEVCPSGARGGCTPPILHVLGSSELTGTTLSLLNGVELVMSEDSLMSLSGDLSLGVADTCADGARGGCTPPILAITDSSELILEGDFNWLNSAIVEYSSTAPMQIGGDFVNQATNPANFDWINGALTFNAGSAFGPQGQTLEAAGEDRGPVPQGFDTNFAMGTVELAAGALLTVVDVFDNQQDGQTVCDEALYVDTLIVGEGAELITGGCAVYYNTLDLSDSGQIPGLGVDVLQILICEGDANGDGAVDPLDSGFVLARFGCTYPGDGPNCLMADVNGDGAVDPLDVGFILARFGQCL